MEGTTESARSDGALAPVVGQERKGALDTLRGIALLGILLMNIVAMGVRAAPEKRAAIPTTAKAETLS